MRSTAKVFLILSAIWGGLSVMSGTVFLFDEKILVGIISLISGLAALVVSIIALIKLSRARTRRDLLAIGIVTLLFANIVAGILFLKMGDYELNGGVGGYSYGIPYTVKETPDGESMSGNTGHTSYTSNTPPYGTPFGNPDVPPYGGANGAPFAAPKKDEETPKDETNS